MATAIAKRQATEIDIRRDNENHPHLYRLQQGYVVKALEAIITKAFMYKGQRANVTDVKFIAQNVYAETMKDKALQMFKVAEVEEAIIKGVTGRLEMYGINVGSIIGVLWEFYKSEIVERNKEVNRRMSEEEKERQFLLFQEHKAELKAAMKELNIKKIK
jgi:hypothetical protein